MAILLDTGFIYAAYNPLDINHSLALEILKEIESQKFGSVVITDYVLIEFYRLHTLGSHGKPGHTMDCNL